MSKDNAKSNRANDAWATIRGFVYQVDHSIKAWVNLKPGEHLELEAMEDIDICVDALKRRVLGQVKHRENNFSLNTKAFQEAILNHYNHYRVDDKIRFAFITNAGIAKEQNASFLNESGGKITGVEAWKAIQSTSITLKFKKQYLYEIRILLAGVSFFNQTESGRTFIDKLQSSDTFCEAFIKSVNIIDHAPDAKRIKTEILNKLIRYQLAKDEIEADLLYKNLFFKVFEIISNKDPEKKSHKEWFNLDRLKEISAQKAESWLIKSVSDYIEEILEEIRAFMLELQGKVDTLTEAIEHLKPNRVNHHILSTVFSKHLKLQIDQIGHGKYNPEKFISREIEQKLQYRINYFEYGGAQIKLIKEKLGLISKEYGLKPPQGLLTTSSSVQNQKDLLELKLNFRYDQLIECRAQIGKTISAMSNSGASFDPTLTQTLQLFPFLDSKLINGFEEAITTYVRTRRKSANLHDSEYHKLLAILPSIAPLNHKHFYTYEELRNFEGRREFATELIQKLELALKRISKRCYALIGQAGHGKTNIFCHLAENLAGKGHYCLLLSGQKKISHEYDIGFRVKQILEKEIGANHGDWVRKVNNILELEHKRMFIFFDALNENSSPDVLNQSLQEFNQSILNTRIFLLVSCRDILWELFEPSLQSFLFASGNICQVDKYSRKEWFSARKTYLKGAIHNDFALAKESLLTDPLLLNLHSQVQNNLESPQSREPKRAMVFDLYLDYVSLRVARKKGLMPGKGAKLQKNYLISVASRLWKQHKRWLSYEELELSERDIARPDSRLNMFLGENVLAINPDDKIGFVYEGFMEFLIAKGWLKIAGETKIELSELLQEQFEFIDTYPPIFGAILYLEELSEFEGAITNQMIDYLSTAKFGFFKERQTLVLTAFKQIKLHQVTEKTLAALEAFEALASPAIKDQLGSVALKIVGAYPDSQAAQRLLQKIVEIQEKGASASLKWRTSESSPYPMLPPSTYHYSEAVKLDAIGILALSKDEERNKIIHDAINRLGRTDLHSALTALQNIDVGDDELVYQMVAKYIDKPVVEYQILCAWLLRKRYGTTAAKHLVKLLTHSETRVHKYALKIFAERQVDVHLITEIIEVLRRHWSALKSWHKINLIKVLGLVNQNGENTDLIKLGNTIVNMLNLFITQNDNHVRLESFKVLMVYIDFINQAEVLDKMKNDDDLYIRELGRRY